MSEYTPTNWQSGDIATAARFNKLEQGVGAMSAGYTPHVWQDGDVPTAAQMNALEQAVAAGGGGSSDFSTATVTFVTNLSDHYAQIYSAIYDISSGIEYPTSLTTVTLADVEITNGAVYTVALYNGNAYVIVYTNNVTVSGNATAEEYDSENEVWLITITGDCTITIS